MTTVCITGGSGFIGSHVVDKLLKRGDKVICVDNFNTQYKPSIKLKNIKPHLEDINFKLMNVDITNYDQLYKLFATNKIDKIIHLAARASVPGSIKTPIIYTRDNTGGTAILLEIAREFGIKDIIFASTSAMYGKNDVLPFKESDQTNNILSPYAATKAASEILAKTYTTFTDMNIVALRFFTVYGPRNRPDMAITKFADKIMKGETIQIYGENTQRDWTYVMDVVDGIIKILDKTGTELKGYSVFNIGGGKTIKVKDFVSLLAKQLGKQAITEVVELPPSEAPSTQADTTKLESVIDWKPSTSLEDGLKEFVVWYKDEHSIR